jgi:hypothetical protein
MQSWVAWFVVIATVAIVLQVVVLFLLYIELRRAGTKIARVAEDFEARISPTLTRLGRLLEDSQGRLTSIVNDSAEIVALAREQAQRFDRVLSEASDRLRLQIIHADHILTGALETIEDTGGRLRKAVVGPMENAAALIEGIKTGIDFFRGQRRAPERAQETRDEELFI